jgi:hypothetical protein
MSTCDDERIVVDTIRSRGIVKFMDHYRCQLNSFNDSNNLVLTFR